MKNLLAQVDLGGPIQGVGKFQQGFQSDDNYTLGSRLSSLISDIITVFTIVAGLAFIVYFMIGAFKWITSGGDQNKTEEAKRQLTQAAIGLIVVIVAYFVIDIVGSILGLDLLNPGELIFTNISRP